MVMTGLSHERVTTSMFSLESKKISFLGDQDSLIFFLNDSLLEERNRPPRHSHNPKRVARNLQRFVVTGSPPCKNFSL